MLNPSLVVLSKSLGGLVELKHFPLENKYVQKMKNVKNRVFNKNNKKRKDIFLHLYGIDSHYVLSIISDYMFHNLDIMLVNNLDFFAWPSSGA